MFFASTLLPNPHVQIHQHSHWPPDGCGEMVTGNRGHEWHVAGGGPSLALSPREPLAGFPSLLALDSRMSTSLAVAPTTILGYFMGPTWSQWEET